MQLTMFGDLSPATRAALEKTSRAEPFAQTPITVKTETTPPSVAVAYAGGTAPKPMAAASPAYVTDLLTLLLGSQEFQKR